MQSTDRCRPTLRTRPSRRHAPRNPRAPDARFRTDVFRATRAAHPRAARRRSCESSQEETWLLSPPGTRAPAHACVELLEKLLDGIERGAVLTALARGSDQIDEFHSEPEFGDPASDRLRAERRREL